MIDPTIKALTSAIGQAETGQGGTQAYTKRGASGEYGRYQFMPDTWKAYASEAGVTTPLEQASVEDQNKVAYTKIAKWKSEGYNPAQIASMWNAGPGKPNAYKEGWKGVNAKGVAYDTPAYAQKVSQYYLQQKQGIPEAPMQGPVQPQQEGGGIGDVLKSMVSAPVTMLARPFQAGAELLGASAESVNKWSDKLSGGLIAPVPQNLRDVKKDIGRGIQTAAFGMGPVSGGAAFGAGYSLEEGNDLMSAQTAFSTVLGAGAGKVLDLVGKPLLNGAGRVVGVITPQVLKNVAGKGAQAITQFMAQHEILPKAVSTGINKGAEMLERGVNAPFRVGGNIVKAPFVQNDTKVIAAREKALQDLEEKYAQLRANAVRDPKGTAASRGRVARSNVLTEDGMINEDGVIIGAARASEAYEADAIGQGNKVVRQLLEREGVALDLNTVQREMERVMRETFDGAELTKALKQVQREIDGLRIKRPNGRISLAELHDNKISSRPKGKDYDDPTKAKLKKAISRTYKETIEKNSKENIREINAELQKFYDDAEYIANLQGKRIDSGKLGKAVARVGGALSGAVIGGALGGLPGVAAGSYVGGVVSSKLAGRSLQKAFGKPTKLVTPKSRVIGEAVAKANAPRNQLALPAPSGKTPIPLQPPKRASSVTGVKAPSYVDRNPKTGQFMKVFLSSSELPVPSKVAETAYKSTVENGGITISLKGDTPTKGLAYAPFKGTERVIPKKDFTPKHLDQYLDDHFDELTQPGNHLGTWEFEGNIYMDVSKVGPNTPETKELAVKASQLGVFDLESFQTIELGKLQDGRYIRTYAKETNLPNLNGGEVKGANSKGSSGELPEVRKGVKPVAKKGASEVGKKRDSTQYKQFGSQLRKQIKRDLLSDKTKAVVIDSDTIKKKHPDFNPDKPQLLHEESSSLSKELLRLAVDEDATGIFRMTGGGPGSGKSEAVLKRIKSQPSVIFDGVLGKVGSASEKIDYALSKGKRVELYPVYTPIELATLFNRARKRTVPSDVLVAEHFGFRDTIPQLMEKYGNKIKVKLYQNVGLGVKPQKLSQKQWEAKEIADARKMSLDEIKKKNDYINELIDEKGVDWTKEHINDILKKIYGEA